MRSIFADSHYWLAIVNKRDQWSAAAEAARRQLGAVVLVTTDEVLTELLAGLSRNGPVLRKAAVSMVRTIWSNPNVKVVPQSRDTFLKALDRYAAREDKNYSLTDCSSMNTMDAEGIKEVLTNDRHFEQEGFTVLVKK